MYEKEEYDLLKYLPPDFVEFIKTSRVSVFIAGGAIRSVFTDTPINDYDLCFRSSNDFRATKDFFEKNYWDNCVSRTLRAITYQIDNAKIQLLFKFIGSIPEILSKFDFTICKGLYAYSEDPKNRWYFDESFFSHLSQRKLIFNPFSLSPIDSFLRIEKFKNRGFTITDFELLKIAMAIQKTHIENYTHLLDVISGCSSGSTTLKDVIENVKEKDDKYEFDKFVEYMNNYEKNYYSMIDALKHGVKKPVNVYVEDDLPF